MKMDNGDLEQILEQLGFRTEYMEFTLKVWRLKNILNAIALPNEIGTLKNHHIYLRNYRNRREILKAMLSAGLGQPTLIVGKEGYVEHFYFGEKQDYAMSLHKTLI